MTGPTVDKFLALLRDGIFRDTAEAICGLGRGTIDSWMTRGRKEHERRDADLQSTGEMPPPTKWARFVTAVENAESLAEAEDWGTLVEVQRARGPSPGLDPVTGKPIPGPLLYPELASKNAQWKRSRKNNLRYGAGSQRTDIMRPGEGGIAGNGEDDARIVMEALDRRIERKLAARDRTNGE